MPYGLGPRHMFIPDTQVKAGEGGKNGIVPLDHLEWAGHYAADKRPDVIVLAGDFYDMPSLSSYDAGRKSSEGRRYEDDIEAGNEGLRVFDRALRKYAPRTYKPRRVVTLGNHEARILRAVEENAKLEGKLSLEDLSFKEFGWTVYPFLKPVKIDGVNYCHYFPLNAQSKVTNSKNGAPSALAQVRRMMASAVAGHKQGLETAIVENPGATYRGIIAGSFYLHEEKGYIPPIGEHYWRGVLLFNDIRDGGNFEICEVSMNYLMKRYG